MSTENTYTIVGNLTADPEVAFTKTGAPYARFSIAHTPRRYDQNTGAWIDGDALFMRCVAWRDTAEHVGESLHKGQRVLAAGQLRQSNWETQEGEKRSSIELHIDEIGPSLRFHTAKAVKAARANAPEPADPWAAPTQPNTTTATNGNGSGSVPGFDDTNEPPF